MTLDNQTYYSIPATYTKIETSTNICNHPKLTTGMTPIKWNQDKFEETKSYDADWYSYVDTSTSEQTLNSKWANAKTKDGSMWVWIPRFAYKINYENSENKSQGGSIDVVFLKGTTNLDFNGNDVTLASYKDENGNIGAYTIHPAFQNGNKSDYEYGEWNNEIEGFWISKFEAGYAGTQGNLNSATDSTTQYSSIVGINGTTQSDITTNYYGTRQVGTKIKYPTFQANRASMNYIGIEEAYNLCRSLKDANDVYGLGNADSHLTKNSEWGAVAYLTYSKYGRNGTDVAHNNVSLNNSISSLYAVTGYARPTSSDTTVTSSLTAVQNGTQAGGWTSVQGQTASSTGNVYGIYDLSGGNWEWTAGYFDTLEETQPTEEQELENTNTLNLEGESNKYRTKYEEITTSTLNNINTTKGEAIWELITNSVTGTKSWNNNEFTFLTETNRFSIRGGDWHENAGAGGFAFSNSNGTGSYNIGFRAVLVVE